MTMGESSLEGWRWAEALELPHPIIQPDQDYI
jgi:hypothetical protein